MDWKLEANNISVSFGPTRVLANLSLQLSSNEAIVLVGENGSGKTTLLDVLTGKRRPDRGTVLVDGSVSPRHAQRLSRFFVKRRVGRSFQKPLVFEQMTVFECLQVASQRGEFLPLWNAVLRTPSHKRREARLGFDADRVLDRLEWHGRAGVLAGELSFGQRKLLGLAQAILAGSSTLVLDEPTAGLARDRAHLVVELLEEWKGAGPGRSLLIATHEPEALERIETRRLVLQGGAIREWKGQL